MKSKDIYSGKELTAWDDGEFITLAFGLTTIAIPYEYLEDLKKDLEKFAKIIRNYKTKGLR